MRDIRIGGERGKSKSGYWEAMSVYFGTREGHSGDRSSCGAR